MASNNHFAYSTPNDREFACANLADRAQGYGYEGHKVDGTDLAACLDVIGGAVATRPRRRPAAIGGRVAPPSRRPWRTRRRQLCPAGNEDRNAGPQDCVALTEQLILEKRLARRRDAQTMARGNFRRSGQSGRDGATRSGTGRERRRLVRDFGARTGGCSRRSRMTNFRMTNDESIPNDEARSTVNAAHCAFRHSVIRHSFVIRHSSFRHCHP